MASPAFPPAFYAKLGTRKSLVQVARAAESMPEDIKENPLAPFSIEQAFQLYCTFCGDVEKTSHALSVEPKLVIAIATAEKWNERLAPLLELQKSKRPGDIERSINRAMNFVQAHRLRLVVERMINRLYQMTDDELVEYCFETTTKRDKDGSETIIKKIVTRPFADLATAMEKCMAQTYHALNDTAPERVKRDDRHSEFHSAADLHSELSKAMSEIRAKDTPQAVLFDAQLKAAEGMPLSEKSS